MPFYKINNLYSIISELKNADIINGPFTSSGHFMRKSHLATSEVNINTPFKPSDNSFRFNFRSVNTLDS